MRPVLRFEEVHALRGVLLNLMRLGQAVEGRNASREVVQRGQVGEIASVATRQNLAQVDQDVGTLIDASQFAGW